MAPLTPPVSPALIIKQDFIMPCAKAGNGPVLRKTCSKVLFFLPEHAYAKCYKNSFSCFLCSFQSKSHKNSFVWSPFFETACHLRNYRTALFIFVSNHGSPLKFSTIEQLKYQIRGKLIKKRNRTYGFPLKILALEQLEYPFKEKNRRKTQSSTKIFE